MSRIKLIKKESGNRKSRKKVIAFIALIAAAAVVAVTGAVVAKNFAKAGERIRFKENEAAHFGKTPVSMSEFMLFSIDIKNGYEKQYGENVWKQEKKDVNGKTETMENIAKEDILEQIRFVKALNKEGRAKGVTLSDAEKKAMNETADEYHAELVKGGVSADVITKKDVRQFYRENYFAQKSYYKITGANSVEASTGSSVAADTKVLTTEEAQKLWKRLVNKWYPDFDYRLDINWDLLDQISFSGTASGDASRTSSITESEDN